MGRNQEMLENGSYKNLLLNLCVPTIVIMIVMVVYNMADTFFIGQTGDPNKIAALSLCAPLFSILSGLGTLFGSGGCTAVSLALGKKDVDHVKSYTSFCCYCAIAMGLLFSIIVLAAPQKICMALGADTDTLEFTVSYLRIVAIGAPFVMFNNVFANVIRADGAAKQSMISNGLGTLSNIALDALFILVFHWDVAGAAWATIIGNIISCIYLLYYVTHKQKIFSLSPKHFKLKSEISLTILSLGVPMACSTILMSLSNVISNRLMISYGSTALAAQGVAGKIGMLNSMLAMGICMGLQPALSYNFGSGNLERMRKIIKNTAFFTLILGSILSVLGFIFRNQLITLFIDNEQVVSYGQIMIFATLSTGPFYGLYQLCQTFLQSTGKASYATFVALLDKGLFFVPLLFLLNYFFGMYGIVFTGPITLIFSLLTGFLFSLKWNKTM